MREQKKYLLAFGKHIDKIRKDAELSFDEMALRCEMEKAQLVRVTTKGSNITVATLYKIAKGCRFLYPN